VFDRLSGRESFVLADVLRAETVGGALLIGAAALAVVWANTPLVSAYHQLQHLRLGPLTAAGWASDGLLTVFFLVAGLELKREFVTGSLRHPAEAVLPIVAALAGMAAPALVFTGVSLLHADHTGLAGWAVPTATDIAFALGVLAIAGSRLPNSLRAFLLTLAIVDDLGAITIIALFFAGPLHVPALVAAAALLACFGIVVNRWPRARATPWLLVPVAVAAWWFTHESGVHATVAGVVMGLLVPVRTRPDNADPVDDAGGPGPAERLEHRLRPWSSIVAVPVFALLSCGVSVALPSLRLAAADAAAVAVVPALVVGKFVGIFGGTWITARCTRARLAADLGWRDVAAVGVLGGIGFTVSLLITELAFAGDPVRVTLVKTAVLVSSVLAGLLGVLVLRLRTRSRDGLDGG